MVFRNFLLNKAPSLGFVLVMVVMSCMHCTAASAASLQYDDIGRLKSVDYGNGNVVAYTYDATGNRLTHNITGTGIPDDTPQLTVNPSATQLPAEQTEPLIQVTNSGGGILDWSAAITAGSSWLSISSGSSGVGDGTIQLLALANTDPDPRSATVRVAASGAVPNTVDVIFNQEGSSVAGVEVLAVVDRFMVTQNVPNPFNPLTTINFAVPEASVVNLAIFDLSGRLVKSLVAGQRFEPGWHSAEWDGTNSHGHRVATGVYFYRFSTPGFNEIKRMTLMK